MADLKDRLQDETGIPPDAQQLFLPGVMGELPDHRSLQELQIYYDLALYPVELRVRSSGHRGPTQAAQQRLSPGDCAAQSQLGGQVRALVLKRAVLASLSAGGRLLQTSRQWAAAAAGDVWSDLCEIVFGLRVAPEESRARFIEATRTVNVHFMDGGAHGCGPSHSGFDCGGEMKPKYHTILPRSATVAEALERTQLQSDGWSHFGHQQTGEDGSRSWTPRDKTSWFVLTASGPVVAVTASTRDNCSLKHLHCEAGGSMERVRDRLLEVYAQEALFGPEGCEADAARCAAEKEMSGIVLHRLALQPIEDLVAGDTTEVVAMIPWISHFYENEYIGWRSSNHWVPGYYSYSNAWLQVCIHEIQHQSGIRGDSAADLRRRHYLLIIGTGWNDSD